MEQDTAGDLATFAVLVNGADVGRDYHVLSLAVSSELNRIPSASLELRDGDPARATFAASNADHFVPGAAIEIRLGYRGSNATVFKGVVVKQGLRVRKESGTLLVECRDKCVRMSVSASCRQFLQRKDSDIIEELVSAHDLEPKVEQTGAAQGEVVQFDTSDWDFVVCRAEANGMVVQARGGKVSVAPPQPGQDPVATVTYGRTLIELDAEIDARVQSAAITAASWNAADQELAQAEASEPAADAGNLTPSQLAEAAGTGTRVLRHGGALRQGELQAWADARLLRERLAKVRGRARCRGFSAAVPGCVVELKGVGQRFEGKLYVSGVRHRLVDGNWETDLQIGLDPRPFAAAYTMRPPAAAGLVPAVAGLQCAVVTALEGDPDHQDRIAVRLPFVTNDGEGLWARLASFDAGKGRGALFRPEIGDEVVLGFIDNDPRHPVVLGSLYSGARQPDEPPSDDNHHKGYLSREGLRLTFDDEKKSIVLETPGGNRARLSDDGKGLVFEDQNGNKIVLDQDGVRIESRKDLVFKAAGGIKVEGGANVELTAQAGFKATGTSSAELSGASTTVKGSATVTVQGGMVRIN